MQDREANADETAMQLKQEMEECRSSIAKYARSLNEDIRAKLHVRSADLW